MKPEEAIEIIKMAMAEVEWDYPMDYAIAFETAIEALERQVPKSPIEVIQFPFDVPCGLCPLCNEGVNAEMDCCMVCGQSLNWEEIENER